MQNVTLTRNVVVGVVAFIGMSNCFGLSLEKNLHLIILRRDYLTIIPRARMVYYTVVHKGHKNPAIYFGKFEW